MRLIDADALKELFSEVIGRIAIKPEMNGNLEHMIRASAMVIQMIDDAPTVQPESCEDDPRADVYYLAEKIGIHQLYALVVQLRGEPEPCEDAVSRQVAIDALEQIFDRCEEIEAHLPEGDPDRTGYKMYPDYMTVWKYLHQLPSAQPEIIHCNSCKYWTQSTGKMKGYGLGRCDFHDADLVTCNGFCYWAERRNDG